MRIEHNQPHMRFIAYNDAGEEMGHIQYVRQPNGDLQAISTAVAEAYRDQGVGKELVDAIVAYTKEQGVLTIAVCPYVAHMFEKYPERYAQ
ncbi:N-acetyltransferase [Eubacteriales bacterium OttesenSCG-928-N14]|nr:N-acetyltransferase [Eubacteriales bacterium OttesenSCG-928-N14]